MPGFVEPGFTVVSEQLRDALANRGPASLLSMAKRDKLLGGFTTGRVVRGHGAGEAEICETRRPRAVGVTEKFPAEILGLENLDPFL